MVLVALPAMQESKPLEPLICYLSSTAIKQRSEGMYVGRFWVAVAAQVPVILEYVSHFNLFYSLISDLLLHK